MSAAIVITIIVIIIIIIIIRMIWKKTSLVNVMPADTQQTVDASSLGDGTGTTNNCTYSIWIYVNDWSVNYGEEKIIFQRSTSLTDPPDLTVSLGPYETTLTVTASILGEAASGYTYYPNQYMSIKTPSDQILLQDITGIGIDESSLFEIQKACDKACNTTNNCTSYVGYNNVCSLREQIGTQPVDYMSLLLGASGYISASKTPSSKHTCIVPNIEIQKWVNIILSASTNNIDIYIDGKLIQSCDLAGELNINNAANVYISPNGKGFNGWNSRFRFLPKYINPHQAISIYKKGHGSSNIGNLDYSLKVSLTNGNQPIGSVNI